MKQELYWYEYLLLILFKQIFNSHKKEHIKRNIEMKERKREEREWKNSKKLRSSPATKSLFRANGGIPFPSWTQRCFCSAPPLHFAAASSSSALSSTYVWIHSYSHSHSHSHSHSSFSLICSALLYHSISSFLFFFFFFSLFTFNLCFYVLLAVQTHFSTPMAVWGEHYWSKILQRDVRVLWLFKLFLFGTHWIRWIVRYSPAGTLAVLYFASSPRAKA